MNVGLLLAAFTYCLRRGPATLREPQAGCKMEYSVKARDAVSLRVIKGLQEIYKNKVRGVEDASSFAFFEVRCTECVKSDRKRSACCTLEACGQNAFMFHMCQLSF
jgi:hypothetical protein